MYVSILFENKSHKKIKKESKKCFVQEGEYKGDGSLWPISIDQVR